MVNSVADQLKQISLIDAPSAGKIAEVVAKIIEAVKRDHRPLNNKQLGVKIGGVSADTIDRLEGGETHKVPASVISGIGAKYGFVYVQPYLELFGCRAIPLVCDEAINALPAATMFAAKLAEAANGRTQMSRQALADMMPTVRAVETVTAMLRARASAMGIAA